MAVPMALKWVVGAVGMAALLAALVPVAVTWIERQQAKDLAGREPYAAGADTGRRVAVVYFSRSGNTGLAARHIAKTLDADLFELKAPDYRLGLAGWSHAMRDARGTEADISPRTIDLSGYDEVYLGSPIWLYAPAPPISAFVEHNRFDGKRVVLFNTYNSEFKPELIAAFKVRVMERGARSFEHKAVRRGRMTAQLPPEAMLREIDDVWSLAEPPTADAANVE